MKPQVVGNALRLCSLASLAIAFAACGSDSSAVPSPGPNEVCNSGDYWTGGDDGSATMNPGLACRACHEREEPSRAYFFMGTVFSDVHEQDLCKAPPPSGGRIEIIDANGNLALTLTPNSVGNFYKKSQSANIALPYTARVVLGDQVKEMTTPQTSGDCNSCHTAQGDDEVPGRIAWPISAGLIG